MAVAQGPCPSCGATIEFGVASSLSKVCPYCRHVVVRTDRDWRDVGRAADLANTPSRVAVGDRGEIRGVAFEVLGRVQLDYGRGPWDEYYCLFGTSDRGWIAEAQGQLYVTMLTSQVPQLPPAASLAPDQRVTLGGYGAFRVSERRTARVLSAEGELPAQPTRERLYADLTGDAGAFATLDYNDGTRPPELYVGHQVPLAELRVVPRGGERPGAQKVSLDAIACPSCGGALPAPADRSIERVACRYCHAITEVASLKVVARQAAAAAIPKIPLGSTATLQGIKYVVIGFMRRSASIEGERFAWHEYLMFAESLGFRWLVEDEGNWLFARPIAGGELQSGSGAVVWHGRPFSVRNENDARVEYVLGEFYWKVEVGETTRATDFISGGDVLSREVGDGEVQWTYSTPVPWKNIAHAFGIATSAGYVPGNSASEGYALPGSGVGGAWFGTSSDGGARAMSGGTIVAIIVFVIVCFVCISFSDDGGFGGFGGGGGGFGGFGGK